MDREDAIEYLQRKGKVSEDKHPEFTDEEEKEIKEVCKKGKIYGDPVAMIQ